MTIPGQKELPGNRTVRACLAVLLLVTLIAIVGPLLSPHSVGDLSFDDNYISPTFEDARFFGTDDLGRDIFVRTLKGTQTTLFVALVAALVSVVIGFVYGAVAGFVGGKLDALMMRAVDALYAMPFIFFVILLMVVFERSLFLIFVAIGAINWLDTARIVRGQTLSLKRRPFVDAARMTGVPTRRIIFRHIAPNLVGVVIVYITLTIPQVILFESFLSFLGLGVQEPQASLGSLVSDGVDRMQRAPWMLLIPGVLLTILLFCFNFLGDGLRDKFDPRNKTQ